MRTFGVREIMKNVPGTVVVICATIIMVALIGSGVFMAYSGSGTDDFMRFLNAVMNGAALLVSTLAAVAAGAAAKSSATVEDRTNGQLDERIRESVRAALLHEDHPGSVRPGRFVGGEG